MGGLLSYGREYMPGPDTRSGMDQLRGLLGAAQPYAEAVGGLLGYQPGMAEALAAEQEMKRQRLAANPGKRISEVLPINEPWPANDAFGAGLMGAFGGSIKAAPKGLDMSHAARMARAKEMGFDVDNPVYHGTSADFYKFKRKTNDVGIHVGTRDQAQNRIEYLEMMGRPADGQQVLPLTTSARRPIRMNDLGSWSSENLRHGMETTGKFRPEDIASAYRSSSSEAGRVKALQNLMARSGYDSVVYRNTGEVPGSMPLLKELDQARKDVFGNRSGVMIDPNDPKHARYLAAQSAYDKFVQDNAVDSLAIFDPRNIRSIHAAFDPAKRNSADLLASVGGLGLLGYGGINGGASE